MLVEHIRTVHDYNIDVDTGVEYYPKGHQWHVLTDAERDRDDHDNSLTVESFDLLDNLCQRIPGVTDTDGYGGFYLTIDMEVVHKAGWTPHDLIQSLQSMGNAILDGQPLEAADAPYQHTTKDVYGGDVTYWRRPALLPLHGRESFEVQYPSEIA